jgi:uncharacterized protein YyaL (SSP411 family)
VRLLALSALIVATGLACQRTPPSDDFAQGVRVETVDGAVRYTNRLIAEKSPYLQLHAHNPVDWFPWGTEAFEKARREGKAIFLSVGYSTCHWCHVMEAESFSNPEIAAFMNAHFVSIKVDREERPDLDRLYQNYVIGVSEGGWPASLFLTPDLKPFFGVNYLSPDDRNGDPGFQTILQRVATLWETRREEALHAADEGTQAMIARSQATTGVTGNATTAQLLDQTYAALEATFDRAEGGFGGAPKFPRPVVLNFLLRYYARTGTPRALEMTLQTLRGMANGGLRDHLGGGFHRYATDRQWRVPHFEKMLYDQAQLALAYIEGYQASRDPFFRDVARDTLRYVMRDMRDPGGGFYSAEDADSRATQTSPQATEGAFYLWSAEEVDRVLGREADLFVYHYGIEPGGNVPAEQDAGELKGLNALSVRHTTAATAARFGRSEAEVRASLEASRARLLDARAARPRPARDDKVLVAWNGLMLSALARAGQVFGEDTYLEAARTEAQFVETRLYDAKTGTLTRRYLHGDVDIDAQLEDYAFFIQGLLDLYEASFEPRWLSWAVRLQAMQDELFWDAADGGYFSTRADAPHVLARAKTEYDGAEPSGNSVSAMNLLRLWQLTDAKAWRDKADATFRAVSVRFARSGAALPQLAAALDYSSSKPRQIVIAGDPGAADTRALLRLVHDRFIPNKILLVADGGAGQAQLMSLVPFVKGMDRRDGRATIYVCENYVCRLPTSDPVVAARLLDGQ